MLENSQLNKTELAAKLGLARSTLYYRSRKKEKDEIDKKLLVAIMDSNPSYGHKRLAPESGMNKKKVLRLMRKMNYLGAEPTRYRERRPELSE